MKVILMTKELEARFAKVWDQSNVGNPIVIAHFFSPYIGRDRYATEYNPKDRVFYWYVKGIENERWTFSLDELSITKWWVPVVERDLYWAEVPVKELY